MRLSVVGVIAAVLLCGAAVSNGAWDPNTDAALTGWWALDEGSGTVAKDSSGHNYNGTVTGGSVWVTGRVKGAIQFDGSSGYVRAPHIALDNRNFTVTMWIKPVLTGSAVVFSTGLTGADNTDMHFRLGGPTSSDAPTRGIRMGFYNNDLSSPSGLLQDNEWYHLSFWYDYDHKIRRIYVNGVQKAEDAGNPFTGTTGDVLIGYWSTGGQYFKGAMDDVRIFTRALTAAEIKSLVPPVLKATKPSPAPGATGVMMPLLSWTPGETIQLQDVYLGTTPELTAANRVLNHVPIAIKMHYAATLVSGQTYYWRVDSIAAGGKVTTGDLWSFTMAPKKAFGPSPRDGDKWIDPNSDLSWQPGTTATGHDVYLSTDRNAVANRDPAARKGEKQADAVLEPGALAAATTYYWLVDEFDAIGTRFDGDVWSFTTNGPGGGIKAEYFRNMTLSGDPFLTEVELGVDHNWGDPGGPDGVSDSFSARWTADLEIAIADTYTFVATTDDGTRLWLDDVLLIDAWVDRSSTASASLPQQLQPGIYSLKMEYYENTGGAVAQLSWESPNFARQIIPAGPLQPPVRAKPINPVDKDVNVPQDVTLLWSVGENAATHDIYFGDDAAAVAAATPADTAVYKGNQAVEENTWAPGTLEWNKTYYWRVDEVNTAAETSPWKGAVWSFTTADFLVVDNFESYVDADVGRIFQSWIDGWGYTTPEPGNVGNGTCSTVGYTDAPFAEQGVVHSGGQSMPFDYNNITSPYYAETDRTFSPAQNWKVNNVSTLVLYFQGYPAKFVDDGTTITVSAAGADIWGNADQFRFAYKKLAGDGSITAKVNSLVQTNVWAKAGVMLRESLAAGSTNAATIVSAASGVQLQYRSLNDDVTSNVAQAGLVAPYWVRLTRTGNTFKAEMSADGKTWTSITADAAASSTDVLTTGTLYIGLCVTSHNGDPDIATTAVFSDIKTTGSVSGQWQVADIGISHPGNDVEPLYVAIQDSAGKLAIVKNPDAQAVLSATWTAWKIPTSSFTGVNLGSVKKMYIGVGDRTTPKAGGHGKLFIDDIRVIK